MTENENKIIIINELLKVVWNNIWVQDPTTELNQCPRLGVNNNFQNAFMNRITGFLGELYFYEMNQQSPSIFRGGWFVPKYKEQNPLENSCYFSISKMQLGQEKIYKALGAALPDIDMYLIVPNDLNEILNGSHKSYKYLKYIRRDEEFSEINANDFYLFWGKKASPSKGQLDFDSMNNWTVQDEARKLLLETGISVGALESLLHDRFIFDFQISCKHWKGRPTDLDFIELLPDGNVRLIDTKDKYLSRDDMLGMNSDHLSLFVQIDRLLGTDSSYVVRLRKEKESRELQGWFSAPIKAFSEGVHCSYGNKGMNGDAGADTLMIPFAKFQPWSNGEGIVDEKDKSRPPNIKLI